MLIWKVVVCPKDSACQGLQLSYGVYDVHEGKRPKSWQLYFRAWLKEHSFTKGLAILSHGAGTAHGGGTIFDMNF